MKIIPATMFIVNMSQSMMNDLEKIYLYGEILIDAVVLISPFSEGGNCKKEAQKGSNISNVKPMYKKVLLKS